MNDDDDVNDDGTVTITRALADLLVARAPPETRVDHARAHTHGLLDCVMKSRDRGKRK